MAVKQITAIENAQIVLENGILWDGVILLSEGRIKEFGRARDVTISDGALRIDAKGAYVGPGFVDIHVHGGGGYSTCFETKRAAEFFLQHGATSFLATPDYLMPFDEFLEAIRAIKAAAASAQNLRGIYMEGPYLNTAYGSQSWKNPWGGQIDEKQFKTLIDEAGTLAKVWVVAPEREGLLPFLEYARKVNTDVVFAVGHSEATPAQIRSLGKYRPVLQTHSMCATGRLPVMAGTRGYGPDEYCMREPDVYTELISDSYGIHVNAEMQQLLLHNKGIERVILITDSVVSDMENPPELAHIADLNFDEKGTLNGSNMTMEQTCRNIMTNTNCGIAQAFCMASTNPAKVIGLGDECGSIASGKRADLVFVDDKFHVEQVMLNGELCRF